MQKQADFYVNTLYPLQDKAFRTIDKAGTSFYLTGGTALSRCHLNHRYSDDLDFFLIQAADFLKETEKVIEVLGGSFSIERGISSDSFVRIIISEGDFSLKIEMVNGVGYHAGDFFSHPLFSRVDNPMNILSNKMSALQRNLAKDVMDVVFICLNYDFDWVEIFEDVERKGAWTHELWVVNHLNKFDFSNLETAHLTKPMDVPLLRQHCIAIAIDIIKGERDSLHKPK